MYELQFTSDAATFLAAAGDHLARQPVLSTVPATIAERAAREDAEGLLRDPDRPWWFVTVVDDGVGDHDGAEPGSVDGSPTVRPRSGAPAEVVGAAMRTAPGPDHALWIHQMPAQAAIQLARALHDRGESISAVNGCLPVAQQVAEETARLTGRSVAIDMPTRLYELETLRPPTGIPGRLRPATEDDGDLLDHWLTIFGVEAAEQGQRPIPEMVEHDRADTLHRIADARLWLWEVDGHPVHLTGNTLPSLGVARVAPVLTPKEHRGHGYAAAAVAAVSQHLLDLGARVCLFTDRGNPVSNKLYQRIGYRCVVEMANFVLV